MKAAEVRLEQVGKRYGEQWVVRAVNLHIRAGDFFTFLGPSGCGKTTLLRMIAGFAVPDEGVIRIDGDTINAVPPWQRDIGMVFQNYALWPHMSVFENVAFGLRERKVARGEIDQQVRAALEKVDLKDCEARRPSQLSGGQQQRVALARTLVIQPRVLLLDEPLSNLDAKLRVEMRLELLKLQRDLGLTTIYVTHDQEEALAMSTQIAVMNRGQVVQVGAPRQIYEEPVDVFIAGFVGQANLLRGRVERMTDENCEVIVGNDQRIAIELAEPMRGLTSGTPVKISIRPEAIELCAGTEGESGANRIEAVVTAAAYQGAFVEYEVAAVDQIVKVRAAHARGGRLFQRGERVQLSFAAAAVNLLLDASKT